MTTEKADSVDKKALKAMNNTLSDESKKEEEVRDQSLLAINVSDDKDILDLMANSNSDSEEESPEVKVKEK
ncbi:hypothetical protein HAX54_026555 [Datura stramonium]|uniref:Uncharacterized protein n=1 Tax=Datura stramonium TaxID=4076 RepID=A0ABS8V2F0_DATST|nr:hypothetical protein [Datura stramonium]